MEITELTVKGLNNYYDSLSILGYRPQSDTEKLLILSFIEELLCGATKALVTEEDYRTVSRAMLCMYGSCLVPYSQYHGNGMFGILSDGYAVSPRITEDSNIRFTEDNAVRFRSGL